MHFSSNLEVANQFCHASCPCEVGQTIQRLAAFDLVQGLLMQACHASCLSFLVQMCARLAQAGHGLQAEHYFELSPCCLAHITHCKCVNYSAMGKRQHKLLCQRPYPLSTYLLSLRSQSLGGLWHSGLFLSSSSVSLHCKHMTSLLTWC